MTAALEVLAVDEDGRVQLFASVAQDLLARGYSINPGALAPGLAQAMLQQLRATSPQSFTPAGTGRRQGRAHNPLVRRDSIHWITGESEAGRQWLEWAGELQTFLNRELFLGLASFESHFAHYPEGAFYRRHLDAFRGESNRVLSLVAYLNPDWVEANGGELVLFRAGSDGGSIAVSPVLGTLVLFLSEEFEHEVLPTRCDRFSIAGWFRANNASDPIPCE